MAGFDWFFTYDADDEAVVRAMLTASLTASRRRARRMEVQWSSRIDSSAHHAHVTIDGPWWLLELPIARLDRDLPAICEAIEDSRRRPDHRRRLGHQFPPPAGHEAAARPAGVVPPRLPQCPRSP